MVAVRYATTSDGVRLAWKRSGQGPTLILVPNLVAQVEPGKAMAEWEYFFESHFNYIRYDLRGIGLSGGPVKPASGDEWSSDLETIVQAAEVTEPYILLGWSHGTMTAIKHAYHHPDQVKSVITYAGSYDGFKLHGDQALAAVNINIVSVSVARTEPMFMQQFMQSLLPQGSAARHTAMADHIRRSFSSDAAKQFFNVMGECSVEKLVPQLQLPLLCLHSRDEGTVLSRHSKELVSLANDAQLVLLDSANHIIGEEDAAWRVFCTAILEFTNVPQRQSSNFDGADLTNREHEILVLVCTGKSNKEIAQSLSISEKTVRNNLSRVFSKIGVATRAEAIIKYMHR